MRTEILIPILLAASLSACNGFGPRKAPPIASLPDATIATELPIFKKQVNEIEVADSMGDMDPTFVLGAIVNTKTGQIRGLDSFLTHDAKPAIVPRSEIVFKNLVENSLVRNAAWLDFLKGQVGDTIRAEVSVIKASRVTVRSSEVDRKKLLAEAKAIPATERGNYGIVIGYVSFLISATLFKSSEQEGSASGFGAKIGGKWYNKSENTSVNHRIIVVSSPLPFVLEIAAKPRPVNLDTATTEAIYKRLLYIPSMPDYAKIVKPERAKDM